MVPGAQIDPQQPDLLNQAHGRALRLREVLLTHEAELLRHVESAEKSACLNEPDSAVLRDGVDRIRQAADAAGRLIEGMTRALQDDQGR